QPLSKILDISKLSDQPASKISELWTGYHTLKNKLSAVIPTETYKELITNAKKYPQFVLPLPRKIVGGEETENVAPGEVKQGYEMQFMEWGFLPAPKNPFGSSRATCNPIATTVLFTPLAEYKLRQEFAQPLLVLTHYTDLSASKGIVLMRGEITSSSEQEQAQTLSTTEEEEPVDRGREGRMSMQDAQLLVMCLQRFYLSRMGSASASSSSSSETNSTSSSPSSSPEERLNLLEVFHRQPEQFRVDELVKAAYDFS
ncbi:hypothetical protein IE53DRAFT_392982, partial [Violaceomyces palustris]